MATAAMINYSLHPGMTIRYIKGEYVGENRNVKQIIEDIFPHINEVNAGHAKRILTQGCPSQINFEETSKMKAGIIEKGNQATFKMYLKIVRKTMNKEGKHSHLLPVKLWVLHFSPYCCHTAQGMLVKPGKIPQVILMPQQKETLVLNEITTMEFKANIAFGLAKLKLLQQIYNWRVSHPRSIIYLALADICTCF